MRKQTSGRIRILVNPDIGNQQAPYATTHESKAETNVANSPLEAINSMSSIHNSKSESSVVDHSPQNGWKIVKEETIEEAIEPIAPSSLSNSPSKPSWPASQSEGIRDSIDRLDSFQMASEAQPTRLQRPNEQDAALDNNQNQSEDSSTLRRSSQPRPALAPAKLQIGVDSRRAQTSRPIVGDNQFGMPAARPNNDGRDESDLGNAQPVTSIFDLLAALSTSTTTLAPPAISDEELTDNQNGDLAKQDYGYQPSPSNKNNNGRKPVSSNEPSVGGFSEEYQQPSQQQSMNKKPSSRPPQLVTSDQTSFGSEQKPSESSLNKPNPAIMRRPNTRNGPCPPTGTTTVEHPTACDKYYLCNNGHATEQQCPNGLLYGTKDTVVDNCVHRWNTTCGDKTIPNPISSPGCRWQYGIFPVQGVPKCSIDYYECKAGVHEVKRCTVEGQIYDDRTKTCQWAEVLGCQSDALAHFTCPVDDQGNTYWPFPRYYLNRQDIIMCVNDKPQLVHCAEHQRVDPEHLHCVPNENDMREARNKKAKKTQASADKNKKKPVE